MYARYSEWEPPVYAEMLRRRGTLLEQTSFPHMDVALLRVGGSGRGDPAGGRAVSARCG